MSSSDDQRSRAKWDVFVAEDSMMAALADKIADRVAEKLRPRRPPRVPRTEPLSSGPSIYPDARECLDDVNTTLENMVREWDEVTVQGLCDRMPKKLSPRTLKARLVEVKVFERDMRWTLRKLAEPFRKKHNMLLALGATLLLSSDTLISGCIKGL